MTDETPALRIASPDLRPLQAAPLAYTGDGENKEPTLVITGVPPHTVELAVIMHDADAPLPQGFTHWVLYGIPPRDQTIDVATVRVGPHGYGEHVYVGPRPPRGHGRHHYYFWVYALDTAVSGTPTREEFLEAYASHVISLNRFVVHYER